MTPSETLKDLRALASRASQEQFIRERPDAVLLLRQPGSELDARGAFHTGHVSLFTADLAAQPGDLLWFAIAKRPGAVFSGQYTVGRTRNTDICINHPKVSKLHCYFTRGGPEAAPGYQVVDAGSTNGTWLNGQRLDRDLPYPLRDRDRLRIGQPQCAFFSALGLYRLLRGDLGELRSL